MLTFKKPQVTEAKLVLADYVSVHVSTPEHSAIQNTEPRALLVNREEIFTRIQKQRGAFLPPIKQHKGDLIDVRLRAAATAKRRLKHVSETPTSEGKIVA